MQFHIGSIVTFIEANYLGVRFGNVTDTASAWKFNNVSDMLSEDSDEVVEADMFYTNSSIDLSAPSAGAFSGIADVTCSVGGSVVNNNDGTFTVTFGSIYYDEVTVTITFSLKGGGTETRQMKIKRAAIGSFDAQLNEDNYDETNGINLLPILTHSSEYPLLFSAGEGRRAYAIFYTGESYLSSPSSPYGMFAKYTYADGSTKTEVITECIQAYEDQYEGGQRFCAYQLWSNLDDRKPLYVDVTILKSNPADPNATSFSGVGYGSKTGERIYLGD